MIPIVRVLEEEMGISCGGGNFSIPCPFHNDANPSLRVYAGSDDGMGSFYCFGCGKFGNGLDFIRFYRGLGWSDLKEYVFRKYGIGLEDKVKRERAGRDAGLDGMLKAISVADRSFLTNEKFIRAVEISIARFLQGNPSDLGKCLEAAMSVNTVRVEDISF